MKKNDWILIATLALYSFLFYKESAGINFVLFNLALIIALIIKDKQILKNSAWLLTASGSMLSAICIGYYGNGLSITANIISLSILSALSYSSKSSVIISLLFSFYSYASAIVFMILSWQQRLLSEKDPTHSKRKWSLILVPISITILFFFMYRSSNALFNDFTKNLNLDFISADWVFFTLGGLLLLFGFFHHQKIKEIAEVDENASNDIDPLKSKPITLFGKQLSISDEEFSGKLLFLLLNILLLFVNVLDIHFMFISNALPAGVTYSEFVHQGTGMLITSILMAIAIILFYFRGALNFSDKSKMIRILAYVWIAQNAFMILSTLFRNNMYVTEYGLTYKRIGVYVYLLLTWAGLITTFIKIAKVKTNAYLFRVNGWIFYSVLIIAAFINWDKLITEVNITKAKQVQTDYLLDLSYTALPKLYTYHNDSLQTDSISDKNDAFIINNFNRKRDAKLYHFLQDREQLGWKSWYYDQDDTFKKLLDMHNEQKLTGLNLSFLKIESLNVLKDLQNIRSLNLMGNTIKDTKELKDFKELKELNLRANLLVNLSGIESMRNLQTLDIQQNDIRDYSSLFKLQNLKTVYVDSKITASNYELLRKNLPLTTIVQN
jgi:hypothetical protein